MWLWGMVIAKADVMFEEGYNPQKQLLAYCVDVDQTAAMMCYIQLALWGIPAAVTIGNTLQCSSRAPCLHRCIT